MTTMNLLRYPLAVIGSLAMIGGVMARIGLICQVHAASAGLDIPGAVATPDTGLAMRMIAVGILAWLVAWLPDRNDTE